MSSKPVPRQPVEVLQSGDLVDDRELAAFDSDRLDHERIVDQLVDLVTTVEMPTNIALYGPWGSGKTGIANLLKKRLNEPAHAKAKVKFARFDAFKYADIPLRRNFIVAVARELKVNKKDYKEDLYAAKSSSDITVPDENLLTIAGWFLGLAAALLSVLVAFIALVSLIQPGSWSDDFAKNVSGALPGGLIAPALLAAVFTLVGKSLTVDRSVSRPDSVEQFEDLFKALVDDSGAERLVIFVDELDRCTAKEVVDTLDAVRTFLGVPKCVFVVAADQQVLEQALSEEARQETPTDSANPYYSTGSAYLDKVFQYQMSLPPLLPQSVTEFAIKAVKDNGGLWAEIAPVDYVVSILIPSHVTSPRRVKHLLNTYALTYRLAQAKYNAGRLQEDPHESAQAIARLVCLRVEFPNFARDLTLDARLPEYVLVLREDPDADLGERVSDQVRAKALAYATGSASPARLLTHAEPDETEPTENDDEPTQDSHDADGADDGEDQQSPAPRLEQGRQLLTYLSKTRNIEGPSRDLIYLHSLGSIYGLDSDVAQDLITALQDGQSRDVHRQYKDATAEDQPKILDLISGQIGGTYGIERLNAAHVLLNLVQSEPDLDVNRIADTTGELLSAMHRNNEPVFNDNNVAGGWLLATASTGGGATNLQRTLITLLAAKDWDATFLFERPTQALAVSASAAQKVLSRTLVSDDAQTAVDQLLVLDPAVQKRVLQLIEASAGNRLAAAFKANQEADAAAEAQQEAVAAGTAEAGSTPSTGQPTIDTAKVLAALKSLIEGLANVQPDLAWIGMHILLVGDHLEARNTVNALVSNLPPTSDPAIASSLLTNVQNRALSAWRQWLHAIPANVITDTHNDTLISAADTCVRQATKEQDERPSVDAVTAAVDELTRLTENQTDLTLDVTTKMVEAIQPAVTTDAEAQDRTDLDQHIRPLIAAGFADIEQIATIEIATVRTTLQAALPAQPETGPLVNWVLTGAPRTTSAFTQPDDTRTADLIQFAAEVRNCAWIPEPTRLQGATSVLAAIAPAGHTQAVQNAVTIDELETFIGQYGQPASATATTWISLVQPDRATTQRVINALRDTAALDGDAARAIADNAATWPDDEQLALATQYLQSPSQDMPEPDLLTAIRLQELDNDQVANLLVTRFAASGSNPAKDTVIGLWKAAALPADLASRFYTDIVIPWLQANVGDQSNAEAVRRALHAMAEVNLPIPDDLRSEFADAVIDATDGDRDLTAKAVPVLEHHGYSADRVGILHKRLEVKDED